MHKALSATGMSVWGGRPQPEFLYVLCVCVCPGQGKYAQNVRHKDNVCVSFVCVARDNVLLIHCKATPQRDRLQGHGKVGVRVA